MTRKCTAMTRVPTYYVRSLLITAYCAAAVVPHTSLYACDFRATSDALSGRLLMVKGCGGGGMKNRAFRPDTRKYMMFAFARSTLLSRVHVALAHL